MFCEFKGIAAMTILHRDHQSKFSKANLMKTSGFSAAGVMVLFGLINIGPGLGASLSLIAVAILAAIAFHSMADKHSTFHFSLPLGFIQFSLMAWIAFTLLPSSFDGSQPIIMMTQAHIIAAILASVPLMPVLVSAELLCSAGVVKILKRQQR